MLLQALESEPVDGSVPALSCSLLPSSLLCIAHKNDSFAMYEVYESLAVREVFYWSRMGDTQSFFGYSTR